MAQLTGIYHIALHTDDAAAFEQAMVDDIMPSIEVLSRGVSGVTQNLSKLYQKDGAPQYRWAVTLGHFGDDASESIGSAIPAYFDDIRGQAVGRIAPHAVLIGFEMTIPIVA